MKKRIVSLLLVLTMVIGMIPFAAAASAPETVYISVSDDSRYIAGADGQPIANRAVTLEELAAIDLSSYNLGDYAYDADGDGSYEITALHLYIYVHENICGLSFSDVGISGSAGSIYFYAGLFGFSDENLRYDYNGAYPAVDGWGLTADQIVLSDGDFLNIAHYTSWAFWGDSATGFHYFADSTGGLVQEYTATSGEMLQVNLVRSYSDVASGGNTAYTQEPYFEVFYGTSYDSPAGSVVTDDYGRASIVFPEAGTWYVWCEGGYGMENPDATVSAPAFATVTVSAVQEPADPIDVYVTVANAGEVVMAQQKVTVKDRNANGTFDIDETLYAAHEAGYTGGAAGYASEETSYGLSIAKLWGDESGNYGYWLNNASCWSLADTVVSGDHLVAFVYQNTTTWDSYARFGRYDYTALAEVPLAVTLERAGYDASWNTVFSGHSGASVTVYDSGLVQLDPNSYEVVDNEDGTYAVTIKDPGSYIVVAYDNATPIVPAVCCVTVCDNPDVAYADQVEAKIEAIGTVTVFSGSRIAAARSAYDGLTESQKALVENTNVLTAAEETLAVLYVQASQVDHQMVFTATADYLAGLGTPSVGSTGGEWMVIDMTRAGQTCPEGYYENVVAYVNQKINDNEQLHRAKSTDNSRVILALTSAGYDVTDVAGHNLLMGLTDMAYVKKQGINGPIWALIALDTHNYEIPANPNATEQVTREKLIAYILEKQLDDGGWALSGTVADTDMTGMAIQSLAPYYTSDAEVKAAVDTALACLSLKQHDNGGYGSVDGTCSESCAQVIVALTALGIDPQTDPRFIKNGISVVDAMCLFAVDGGGFAHIPDGALNGMATEQGQYALAAYFRFKNGQTALYDMTDVTLPGEAVAQMIDTIGSVTLESDETISAARAAYDALSAYQKALVTNYDLLTDAETALELLAAQSHSGWKLENGKWAYYENGEKKTNAWIMDSVGWCYVGADGYCVTNAWVRDSVTWCYVGADGRCVTNSWRTDSVGWCYLGDDGRMVTNRWVRDSVTWCYVGADGRCVTNSWRTDSIGWCYLGDDGRMVTNRWQRDSVGWCYLGTDGHCVTGKQVIDGKSYTFTTTGVLMQ